MNRQALIAPCGMNCGICLAYLRSKNRCGGCRNENEHKSVHCDKCVIKNCGFFKTTNSIFCYDCDHFPCARLKQLDKRYQLKYHMSMIENLQMIKQSGQESFVQTESIRWKCMKCGGVLCVHRAYCLKCEEEKKLVQKSAH